jgi:hypothetical protein
MQTLEKIAPIPLKVDIAGERLCILPIKTRELPGMMKAIAPILGEIQGGDILGALSANADSLVAAVAIGSRKDRAWVDDLDLDDLVALAGAVLEVNADFFVHRVLPGLTKAMEGVTGAVGQTQSTPS